MSTTIIKDKVGGRRNFMRTAIVLTLCAFLLVPLTALAHEKVTAGSYQFEIGWVNEPVIVGERNALFLFITPAKDSTKNADEHSHDEDTGEHDHAAESASEHNHIEGITGAEATLKFAVEYGSVRQSYDLRPIVGQPGQYTADFIPTREGQYTFQFTGTINGEAVDLKFEPEEVESLNKLAFPEALPSSAELTAQLAAAQVQATMTQMIAIIGAVLGFIGTGLGVYGLVKK